MRAPSRPPTVKTAEMAANSWGSMGMQSMSVADGLLEVTNVTIFSSVDAAGFFRQVMTSSGAFSSAWARENYQYALVCEEMLR